MSMTDEEERRLARDMSREFGIPGPKDKPIIGGLDPDFAKSIKILAGNRPEGSRLMESERVDLIGLLYGLRCMAVRFAEELPEELERVARVLVARGAPLRAAVLMAERAATEGETNLIALANDVACWPELARWEG